MKYILEIRNLSGGYVPLINILQGVSLELVNGETVSIIGLNGSGKSTLGKAVMNMLPYRDGDILFEGRSVAGFATHDLARIGMAFMLQGGQVFKSLSVQENLQLAFRRQNDKSYVTLLKSIIPLFQNSRNNLSSKMADKLSGGQRQQLALTMALAIKPRLLILDEPSAGLSPGAVDDMYRILGFVRDKMNISILLIEQNINKAITFSDRCVLLEQGRIAQIITNPNVNEIECLMFKK
ncbi:ATP-binding cassette domain-containing protein [Bacteroides uniformis]|uniref:ATP-binding cassette domain-containing protein n=1 Tax=Bacteroides uniformis TaxID=820 RepID=UPI001C37B152|nr:ATP-binding cassette domain-containing protein [Bacteroides uniformis]MBV4218736.1 ATP-binding cassette domain-containing protein [Bacteroides uniformis]MBV4232625.1 ATP-binding cassette domain-containing protein [Bacteroides uniformis]MCB7406293.1 ATP-binding cassette domain-containing protein [Bacteroides uniformis]MCB7417534.1 ATP-binding cassette domain-containing protein [Bacteroides uniformis]